MEIFATDRGYGRRASATVTALFAAAILAPGAGSLLHPAPFFRPGKVHRLAAFKRTFEESFGFRETLIAWHGAFKVRALGVSSSPDVILGTDGWLFFADEASRRSLRRTWPFTQERLEWWVGDVESRGELLAREGIRFLFVVVPDKHTVYPEHVPPVYTRVHDVSNRERLVRRLEERGKVPVLDLTGPLLSAKSWTDVYYRTDTHWNDLGGFVGYREIASRIAPWLPEVRPAVRADFDLVPGTRNGDLARLLGLAGRLMEEDPTLVPRTPRRARFVDPASVDLLSGIDLSVVDPKVLIRDGADLPCAVVLGDSFTAGFRPFLSEHFDRAIYFGGSYRAIPPELLARMRPRVVIQEVVERNLQ